MKNLLFALLFAPTLLFANESKTIKSKIQSVTVYQQGAQVYRKADYNINKGLTVVSLEGISRQIDPKSIQVKGIGEMVILDSKYKLKYPEPIPQGSMPPTPKLDKELSILSDSLVDLDYQLMGNQDKIDVLQMQKSILSHNGSVKGVGKVNDSIPLLKETMSFYYEKMNAINSETLLLTIKKNSLQKVKKRIRNRIQEIQTYKNNKHSLPQRNTSPVSVIEITISANTGVSGKLAVTYMVSGAGWTPLYDIRSNSKVNNIDLTYKAQVYQNTGTDWLNAKLTLSTTNPYSNKTKPNLSPLYVQYYQNIQSADKAKREEYKKYIAAKDADSNTDDLHSETLNATISNESVEETQSKNAINFIQLTEQLISVEYNVNLPYSILSNNEQHLVLVRQESLKSNYKHYAVPKINQSAYLVAELTNLDDLNLIPGVANIFHDGSYIGETKINPSIMADSLALSLGKDQNLQVKRTLLQKDSKTKIIGDKTLKTYAYLIEIKSHKSSTTEITIQDQVPVSRSSDIIIEIDEMSKGKVNEVTGLINWDLKLKPRETRSIKLIYTVSTIKNKPTNLAQN
ncbi:MAG: DUF4139 domain-containing protein [Crocinitomicaceae bacterium]